MTLSDAKTDIRPDISVIILTYNQEGTIGRTLESVLSQNLADATMEVVVSDDCSTDSTLEVCRSYAARYPEVVRIIERHSNLGLVGNYFDTFGHCRGRYIADCAGDDFWVDNLKLRKQLAMLEADSSLSMVHTGWLCCDHGGGNLHIHPSLAGSGRSKPALFERGALCAPLLQRRRGSMIHLSTALYRRDLLQRAIAEAPQLFLDPGNRCEDLPVEVAMAAMGRVAYLPDITLHYTTGHESVSNSADFRKTFRQYYGNVYQTRALQLHYKVDDTLLKEYYRKTCTFLAAQVWHSGDRTLLDRLNTLERTLPVKPTLRHRLYTLLTLLKKVHNHS